MHHEFWLEDTIAVILRHRHAGKTVQNLPWKLISLLGWMIWPRSGRNTNGIFCDVDPLTNGASVHSARRFACETNETQNEKQYELKQKNIKQFIMCVRCDHLWRQNDFVTSFECAVRSPCYQFKTNVVTKRLSASWAPNLKLVCDCALWCTGVDRLVLLLQFKRT